MARSDVYWHFPRTLLVVALITAALYFAQTVFVPLVLAALFSFVLSPLVTRLERRGVQRTAAVLLVTALALVSCGLMGWMATNQVVDLAEKLPSYKKNVELKFQALHGPTGTALGRAFKVLNDLGQQSVMDSWPEIPLPIDLDSGQGVAPLDERAKAVEFSPPPAVAGTPIASKGFSALDFLRNVIAPLFSPLGKVLIVVVLVVFMLIEREELRDRLIRLAGITHMNVTTQALDDAAERVSRYLLMQLAINAVFGTGVAIGLYFIGVPNALMWGLLATVLRFLPYLGFWIAAVIPFLLALAAPTWFQPAATLCLFAGLELLANNLEPRLYGSSTGLSSVAVLGSALFWAWLWGVTGLLLSTPLTVVLVVVGKYVSELQFLQVILGGGQVLEPHVRLYQRTLNTDVDEAGDLFEEFAQGKSLAEAYDTLALPALVLAELDFRMDRIDETRRKLVHDNMSELVQRLGEQRLRAQKAALLLDAQPIMQAEAVRLASIPAICFPARDEADEIAGTMLAQIVQEAGASMQMASIDSLAGEMMETIERENIEVICISSVPSSGLRHARYLCKRIRAKYPNLNMVIVLWCSKLTQDKARRLMDCGENDTITVTAAEAATHILRLVNSGSLRKQARRTTESQCPQPVPA
ncbi:MAG TPA: AI-2E family transporter [Planctomycetota bacterium]|jgi:predicted PurR-regulated permease PerM